jgi:fucose 4-O-acetylase-like acetyltransferase
MKGIGIMAVIAGHTNPDIITGKLISSFHMPLFFIIAGYFYKPNPNCKKKLINDFKRLLTPYITTSIVLTLIFICISEDPISIIKFFLKAFIHADTEDHTSIIWAHVPKIGPIWFLFALFWCRTFYNFIDISSLSHKNLLVILISIVSVITDRYVINLPFSLLPGLSAMVFYLIGKFIRSHQLSQVQIIVCAICWTIHLFFSRIDMCICMYKLYPIDICGAVFGTFVIYNISKLFSISSTISWIFAQLGNTSLIILCAHTLEWSILNINQRCKDNHWITRFIIESIICIILTIIWFQLKNIKHILIHKCKGKN